MFRASASGSCRIEMMLHSLLLSLKPYHWILETSDCFPVQNLPTRSDEYEISGRLRKSEPCSKFWRVHRQFLVNSIHLSRVSDFVSRQR
ncbi:MAG: LytTR family transcriptional regulator DNA-binding domain-containing protein [Octadecabacter sp.]